MASPFSFFRKNATGMMIVMVILSMMLFTLDSLFSSPESNFWLLGLLIGGAIFAIAGTGQGDGRWWKWGIGGAALGVILGLALPRFAASSGTEELGFLSQTEFDELGRNRRIANQVVTRPVYESLPQQFAQQFASQATFGFGQRNENDELMFGKIMRQEASDLGIDVDQSTVKDYLQKVTFKTLSAESLLKIRDTADRTPLSDEELTEILAGELNARLAYMTKYPGGAAYPPSPRVYWNYFKRFNVRQALNTIAIETDAFLDQVPEPSDSELTQLFEQYRSTERLTDGTPGFRQSSRIRLAYLELNADDVKKQIAEVTDEDIQKYYDDNKESPLIRTAVFPDMPDEAAPEEGEGDEEGEPESVLPEEGDMPAATDDAKPEAPKPADPKPEETPEPAAEPKPEAKPETKVEPAKKVETPATEEPAAEPESAPETPQEDPADDCGFQEEPEPEAAPETPQEEATTEEATTEEATTEAAEDKPATEAAADAVEQADADATPDAAASEGDESPQMPLIIPDVPDKPTPDAPSAPEVTYEYRKLEDVKDDIVDEIQRIRTREFIDTRMNAAAAKLQQLASKRMEFRFGKEQAEEYDITSEDDQRELQAATAPLDQEILGEIKAFAEENDLLFVQTPLLDIGELVEGDDYPIADAVDSNINPMMAASAPTAAQEAFSSLGNDYGSAVASLFQNPRRVQENFLASEGGISHFVYVISEFSEPHEPSFDDPGIREKVLLTYKRLKARDLAKARAEELAKTIKEGIAKSGEEKQTMAEAVVDQPIVAGGSAKVQVRSTAPFSWMRVSAASPMQMQQQPRISQSQIRFDDVKGGILEFVRTEFMQAIFDDLKNEEVGVVPNFDKSVIYVVQAVNRFPTPEVGMDGLRERFAKVGLNKFAEEPTTGLMQSMLVNPTIQKWQDRVYTSNGINREARATAN